MTAREALEALKIEQIQIEGKAVRVAKFFEGISVANKALEKQIPKKPIILGYREGREVNTISYLCPICNKHTSRENFCKYCGQALDWGDSE